MAGTWWDRHTSIHLPAATHGKLNRVLLQQHCSCLAVHDAGEHSPVLQCNSSDQLLPLSSGKSGQQQQDQQHICVNLLQQLDAVGWHRIAQLSSDLRHISLQLRDLNGRLHEAVVELSSGFPVSAPTVIMRLPKPFKLKWLPGFSLLQLVQQLEQALLVYQALWAQLEDIDKHTQLLDTPQALAHPYSNCSRCIALGNGASCQLQLSVASPCALPSITFHGPSSIVAGLQNAWYGRAAQLWDEQHSIRENLEAVLQLQLPAPKPGSKKGCTAAMAAALDGNQPGSQAVEDATAAMPEDSDSDIDDYGLGDAGCCCICYSLHLTDPSKPDELGEAASVTCPGASCGRLFHTMCLAEWLGALPTSRRVFNTLFGSCPFCNGPIGVSTRPVVQS